MRCLGYCGDLHVHEIIRRSRLPRSWAHPANYLLLGNRCHDDLQNAPHVVQLAYKMVRDPDNFDLSWINEHTSPAITLRQILFYVSKLGLL